MTDFLKAFQIVLTRCQINNRDDVVRSCYKVCLDGGLNLDFRMFCKLCFRVSKESNVYKPKREVVQHYHSLLDNECKYCGSDQGCECHSTNKYVRTGYGY